MAEKIENQMAKFLTIKLNCEAENDHKAESNEHSGKNRAYWYILPKIVLTYNVLIYKW